MSGRYLLDTNVVIALFGGESAVQTRLDGAREVFVPSIALGELYFGAAKSSHPEANAARIDEFAAFCTVVVTDAVTAQRYGVLKAQLKKKGRPIPQNDLWIAACALQHGLVVATRDGHFEHVEGLEGLQIEAW
jgi:tRNA(fMet)-specific endonuclease VapC